MTLECDWLIVRQRKILNRCKIAKNYNSGMLAGEWGAMSPGPSLGVLIPAVLGSTFSTNWYLHKSCSQHATDNKKFML